MPSKGITAIFCARSCAVLDENFLELLLTENPTRGNIARPAQTHQSREEQQVDKHAHTKSNKERDDDAAGLLHLEQAHTLPYT